MVASNLAIFPSHTSAPTGISTSELSRIPGFGTLSKKALEQTVGHLERRHLAPGEVLFRAGDPPHRTAYIIEDGVTRLTDDDGQTIEIGRGGVVGLANYLDGVPYTTTVKSVGAVSYLTFGNRDVRELHSGCPFLFDVLHVAFAAGLRQEVGEPMTMATGLARPAYSILRSRLVTCVQETTLRDAYDTLCSRKIGSLGVTGSNGNLLGLVTYADLCQALLTDGLKPDDAIGRVNTREIHTVGSATPLTGVREIQQAYRNKYVVVMDNENPLGVISKTDILGTLITQQTAILEKIQNTQDVAGLALQRRRVAVVAGEAREQNRFAARAARVLSDFHLAVQRRCIQITLQELADEGHGHPPAPYAFIIMGSGGRKEMLLNPDQDNGIILWGENAYERSTDLWFTRFAERVNAHLDEAGYPLCPGKIMASNPVFHRTLDAWKRQVSHIADNPTHKAARWANVVFDFDTLYGDDSLTQSLREHVLAVLHKRPRLLHLMVEDDAEGHPALGLFNRLVTDKSGGRKGIIDVKRNGLRILVDAVRIYALRAGIGSLNTIDRVIGLVREGEFDAEFGEAVMSAYDGFTDIAFAHQLGQLHAGDRLDRLISAKQLTPMNHEVLRMAMRITKRLQERLQSDFNTVVF